MTIEFTDKGVAVDLYTMMMLDAVESIEFTGDAPPLAMRVAFREGEPMEVACPAPMPDGFTGRLATRRLDRDRTEVVFRLRESPGVERREEYAESFLCVMQMWAGADEPARVRARAPVSA